MLSGIFLIKQERDQQLKKHGRILEYEQRWTDRQLAMAAHRLSIPNQDIAEIQAIPHGFDKEVWAKMKSKDYGQRLIIAGALIAAEIDRLNLLEGKQGD